MLAIFGIELRLPVEVANLGGNLHRRFGNIESFDSANAAFAPGQRGPICLAADADRCDAANTGNYYSTRLLEFTKHGGCSYSRGLEVGFASVEYHGYLSQTYEGTKGES